MIRLTEPEREAVRRAQIAREAARIVEGGERRHRTLYHLVMRPYDEDGSLDLIVAAARRPGEETGVCLWTVGAERWSLESMTDWHCMSGWCTSWKVPPDELAGKWSVRCRKARADGVPVPCWPFAPIVNAEACRGTRWEWIARAVLRLAPEDAPTALALWPAHPGVELLARAGLSGHWFGPHALRALETEPAVRAWLRDNAATVRDDRLLPSVCLPIARRGGSVDAAREESYYRALWHGCALHGVDRREAAEYCERRNVTRSEYAQLLDLAVACGLDPRSRSVAFPGDPLRMLGCLQRSFDNIRPADAAKRRRSQAVELARRAAEAAERLAERLRPPEGWRVVVPRSQDELVAIGARLHNCIGRGSYGEAMAEGRCVCVVIESPDGPAAAELAGGRVVQCRGPHNGAAPDGALELARRAAAILRGTAA